MVAAAGAGPSPIPQKSLSVEKLVEAIRFCLTPQAAEAASAIATKMKSENGVKQAVASFHSYLRRNSSLDCDIIKGQPAVWSYSRRSSYWRKGNKIRLSKVAAEILLAHLKIDRRSLRKLETNPVVIRTRRWDPFSATILTAIGVAADLGKAAVRLVTKPIKTLAELRQSKEIGLHASMQPDVAARRRELRSEVATAPSATKVSAESESRLSMIGAVALAIVTGLGSLLGTFLTGLAVIPYAFVEGLRSMPNHWGQEIRDFGDIHDWLSGLLVGGQAIFFALYDSITGFVILPFKGVMKHGPCGIISGFAKAVGNLYLLLLAGMSNSILSFRTDVLV